MKKHREVRQRRPGYMQRLEEEDSPRPDNHRILAGVEDTMRGDIVPVLD